MKSKLTKIFILNIVFLFCIIALVNCSSDNPDIYLDETADSSINIGDGGAYYPGADGSTNICEKDEEGNCIDSTDISSIMLSNQLIDYGLSDVDSIECLSIGLPSSVTYEAEIDKDNTSEVDGEYEFQIYNANGDYSDERVMGSGDITICYMRTAIGSHTGQVKILLNSGSSSSAYAYIIKVQGQTLATLFTITAPTEGLIIDSRTGHHEGVDDAEGDYLVTVTGSVNLELQSIFEEGLSSNIYINSAGVKYKTTFDSNGYFSKQVGVPQVEGVYAISLTINTNKDLTLTKTVNVVVANVPSLEIEVRDSSENEVDTSAPTDVSYLTVGIRVPNLYASGSSEAEMPVTLYDIQFNGEELHPDTEIWYEEGWSWCTNSELEYDDGKGFDDTNTLCISLSHITELQDGINTISAKASNVLGETSAEMTLIIDNDKPIITITQPRENELFAPGKTTIKVSGTVKYFAPIDADYVASVPAPKSGETGSYCQPDKEDDPDCPASSIKMWLNVSTSDDNYPIYIYPEYTDSYSTVTEEAAEAYMEGESAFHGNCYTQTTTIENDDGTETSTDRIVCDVPEASFDFTLQVPSEDHHAHLNLYTNALQLQGESTKGHRTIEVTTFQMGEESPHSRTFTPGESLIRSATLTAGQLGLVAGSCALTDDACVDRAPVMLNLSEGVISRDSVQGRNILKVVEHYLNENISFGDVANGWMNWTKDDNDNIDLEADFQRQYMEDNGGERYDAFEDLSPEWQEKFIHQGLHSNIMITKYWALWRYRQWLKENTSGDCSQDPEHCYFEREGDPQEEFNVALDACAGTENSTGVITTAFVPVGDKQYLFEAFGKDPETYTDNDDWPLYADSYDFNDYVSGKWIVQSLDLKEKEDSYNEKGYVDADVCLVPDDPDLEDEYLEKGCDADVSSASVPAFWGSLIAYNLVEKGLLGQQEMLGFEYSINDDTIPLIWSVGKIRLKLKDVIRVTKEEINGTWTNKVILDGSKIKIYGQEIITNNNLSSLFDSSEMEEKSIQIEPFQNCKAYFQSKHPGYFVPFGCSEETAKTFPVVLDRNSVQGQAIYSDLTINGTNASFLGIIWQGVMETFQKMIACMDKEMVNPMISSQYDYPAWVWEGNAFSTDFDWEEFNFGANVENADLNVFDGGITLRLPLSVGVDGVPVFTFASFRETFHLGLDEAESVQQVSYTHAHRNGHLRRGSSNEGLIEYPLTSGNPAGEAFLGVSLNIEEIVNAAAYLIFRKGPMSLLETFEIEDIEKNNNWSVGIDKVVLGRFDICDIAGLIPSDLPPSLLFATIQSQFNESSLHVDLILDPGYPVTLSLNPVDGLDNASEIQIGVTDLQLGIKELKSHTENGETVSNIYTDPKYQSEVVRLRLDGTIKLRVVYHKESGEIHLYIPGYAEQNIHASVPSGKGGATYDDVNVVTDVLDGVVKALFDKMGKDIYEDIEENDDGDPIIDPSLANPTIVIKIKGSENYAAGNISAATLDEFEFELKVDAAENASCGDDIPYYAGESPMGFTPESMTIEPVLNPDIINYGQSQAEEEEEEGVADDENEAPQMTLVASTEYFPMDPCTMLYPTPYVRDDDGNLEREEDPIRDALCDFGIKDVILNPTIEFDNDEGYIHVSSDIIIELESWVK